MRFLAAFLAVLPFSRVKRERVGRSGVFLPRRVPYNPAISAQIGFSAGYID